MVDSTHCFKINPIWNFFFWFFCYLYVSREHSHYARYLHLISQTISHLWKPFCLLLHYWKLFGFQNMRINVIMCENLCRFDALSSSFGSVSLNHYAHYLKIWLMLRKLLMRKILISFSSGGKIIVKIFLNKFGWRRTAMTAKHWI